MWLLPKVTTSEIYVLKLEMSRHDNLTATYDCALSMFNLLTKHVFTSLNVHVLSNLCPCVYFNCI